MRTAFTIKGIPELRRRYAAIKKVVGSATATATGKAVIFLNEKAKDILIADVYTKDRGPYADPLTYELYNSFVAEVVKVGRAAIMGTLTNTSPHGPFLEFGTDDEGTGKHFIPVVNAGALHWIDAQTGADMFSKGHWVQGVTPIHFMERSLTENVAGVQAIYVLEISEALRRF